MTPKSITSIVAFEITRRICPLNLHLLSAILVLPLPLSLLPSLTYPQIPTSHHDAIGSFHDLLIILNRFRRFDLGNDLRGQVRRRPVLRHLLGKIRPDIMNVLGLADEGGGDKIDVILDAEGKVGLVFDGQSGQVHLGKWGIEEGWERGG